MKLLQNRSADALQLFLKSAWKNFLNFIKKVSGRSIVFIISSKPRSSISNKFHDRNQTLQKRFPILFVLTDMSG